MRRADIKITEFCLGRSHKMKPEMRRPDIKITDLCLGRSPKRDGLISK